MEIWRLIGAMFVVAAGIIALAIVWPELRRPKP